MVVSLSGIPKGSLVHKFIVAGKPGRCKLCSAYVEKLEAHHVSYAPEIILKLCHSCHHKVHFFPQRLNEEEIYPVVAIKLINQKILTPLSFSQLVAPSRKVFLKKEFKAPAPVFDFEAKKPALVDKSKVFKDPDLDFIKRIKVSKPDKAR